MTSRPRSVRNILFIMFDQLRFDYLSCAGHPHLKTPHMDALAARGVRFTNAYVQSPICGSSRMSTYTGRYVHSHGASRNNYPLKVGEMTLGDHLRGGGMDAFLIGKTHMEVDAKGMARLGIDPESVIGARVAECGFDVVIRDDGLWPEGPDGSYDPGPSPYNAYLKAKGYNASNPWAENANAVVTDEGEIVSGWFMKYANHPANIPDADSETPWLTSECMAFLDAPERAKTPWLVHLSYIKPHWPYVVPAPYNSMYDARHVLPVVQSEAERTNAHPVYHAYMQTLIARNFSRDDVRKAVIPAYMGLIKQADDQMGRLFAHLEKTGRMDDTMIVITSDHGDYLGDHWLGEKNLFHDCVTKVPLIIYDPRAEADGTRGTTCDALVEQIDLVATFIEANRQKVPDHIVEGRSLSPFLHGTPPQTWRKAVICEMDYSTSPMQAQLKLSSKDARLFMVFDGRFKLVHAEGGFRPMLYDLQTDPHEFVDLGTSSTHEGEIVRMYGLLHAWARRFSQRTAMSEDDIKALTGKAVRKGIVLGLYDGTEVPAELTEKFRFGQ